MKESFEPLCKALHQQLWLTWISDFLFDRLANLKACPWENHYRPKEEYYKHRIIRSAKWNRFLVERLDKRETLYTIRSFLYSKWEKWNTIICEMSTNMVIFKSNGSFYSSYLYLPKTSFIHKMSKNKIHTRNEHLLNTRNGNQPFCNFTDIRPKLSSILKWVKLILVKWAKLKSIFEQSVLEIS